VPCSGLLFDSTISRFWLTHEREIVIGRRPLGPPNIRVSSDLVSRQHARITAHADGFMVEDAGSSGGLYLDDAQVRGRVPIGPGMRLKLCSEVVYTLRTLTAEPLWDALRGEPLPTTFALRMAEQILRALLPLHDAGRCHGDLSPHEILCAEDGSFVLLVQGWAEAGNGDDIVRGNPTYTAPETISEGRIEPATDIYVLGSILFEALSGRRPFPFENVMSHIASKLHGVEPSYPRGWSPALRSFIERAMLVDPRARPSAREAIDLLASQRPSAREALH
jgi:serine/threonine protein kinase